MKHLSKYSRSAQSGFTIVELMIATLVFAVILIVVTSGIVHFTTSYYRGINASATQDAAREVVRVISENIQYAGGSKSAQMIADPSGQKVVVCVGDVRINFDLGDMLTGSGAEYAAFLSSKLGSGDTAGVCAPNPSVPTNYATVGGNELLSKNMRITNISVQSAGAADLYTVEVGVAYGEDDLLCSTVIPAGNSGGCQPTDPAFDMSNAASAGVLRSNGKSLTCKSQTGSQFCYVTHLVTTVNARIAGS